MKTCIDKTCEAVLCEECNDLKPSMCGDRGLQFPKDACDVITFEGVEDVETKQGLCVDLTEGVHAYDGDGAEISYTVEPSEIGCCDVGEHEVTYTAVGKGNKMLPSFCLGKPMLTTADCGLMTKVVTRLVTILQSLPPKIIGAVRTVIPVGATFDPLEGVSGIDDNGKETVVTYEGRYDETTGMVDIASIESDIDQNAKHLKVALEPIQDLHGYDKPWVGGAGKNKLPLTVDNIKNANSNVTWSGNETTKSGVTFTIETDNNGNVQGVKLNGTATSNVQFLLGVGLTFNGDYILNGGLSSNISVSVQGKATSVGADRAFTDDGATSRTSWIYVENGTVCNNVVKPMVRFASEADATYAPYSNICPIEGWTEADTHRTGKNLWDDSIAPTDIEAYSVSGNKGTYKGRNLYLPKGTYTFSYNGTTTTYIYGNVVNADDSLVSTFRLTAPQSLTPTFTLSDGQYAKLYVASGAETELTSGKIQLELGSTATTYEPYQGTTYTTSLGQTVYGGTLDVVTGKMTIEWAMREFDGSRDEAWSFREGANRNRVVLPDVDERTGSYNTDILGNYITATDGADSNPQVWKANINALGNLLVGIPSSIGNISKWVEYLSQNPLQIAYKLASPQTIRLGKQTIALLQGDNNIWSEDGKVEVVYTKAISGVAQFDTEGVYTIYYHTEDECGNETTVKRYLIVGECNTEQAEPVLCKGKICCATLDCSENYLVVCDGTVCDGRVGCSSSEPTICNGKICSAKLSCTQTEITPIEAEV